MTNGQMVEVRCWLIIIIGILIDKSWVWTMGIVCILLIEVLTFVGWFLTRYGKGLDKQIKELEK